MRADVAEVRDPLQEKLLSGQAEVAEEAVRLLNEDPDKARNYLTRTSHEACEEITESYWNLGDLLWTKYDEKW